MLSGIYQIRNKINGHLYVGSAADLDKRKSRHFGDLSRGKHHSCYLQRSYAKYGQSAFVFEVLEYCEKLNLVEREQIYIDALRPVYNIAQRAGSCLGVKHTAETRAKMSAAHKDILAETRAKLSAAGKGRIFTVETREKISAALRGKARTAEHKARLSVAHIGKKPTAETRAKLSAAGMGNKNCLGNKLTAEHKAKISATLMGKHKKKNKLQMIFDV